MNKSIRQPRVFAYMREITQGGVVLPRYRPTEDELEQAVDLWEMGAELPCVFEHRGVVVGESMPIVAALFTAMETDRGNGIRLEHGLLATSISDGTARGRVYQATRHGGRDDGEAYLCRLLDATIPVVSYW